MAKVIIRPTLPSDLPHVIAGPLPCRVRTLTAVLEPDVDEKSQETVLGIGGIAFLPSGVEAFLQPAPHVKARDYAVSCHRAGRMLMRMLQSSGIREVAARCDADNPAAARWLRRLGFVESARQADPGKIIFFWHRRD
jgi:hypothetical protein